MLSNNTQYINVRYIIKVYTSSDIITGEAVIKTTEEEIQTHKNAEEFTALLNLGLNNSPAV
jgi:hypothetical protein